MSEIGLPEEVRRDLERMGNTFPYRHCWAALPPGSDKWELWSKPTTHKRTRQSKAGYTIMAFKRVPFGR